jgi:sirohydrochlorin ferrochelatase
MNGPARSENVAVLLIAHGSRHAPANADLYRVAARLIERGDYPIVEACFLELTEPDIRAGGDRCVAGGASLVLMIPYFLSAGVHLIRDLTAARDELAARHPTVVFKLAPALGPHALLDELVAIRVREAQSTVGTTQYAPSADMAKRYAPVDQAAAKAEPTSDAGSSRIDTIHSSG